MMGTDKREPGGSPRRPKLASGSSLGADWESVNHAILVKCVGTIARKGGALRIGYTRDGGAYAIGVYAGNSYWTDYIRPNDDLEAYLTDLTASFEEYSPTDAASQAPQKPTKR